MSFLQQQRQRLESQILTTKKKPSKRPHSGQPRLNSRKVLREGKLPAINSKLLRRNFRSHKYKKMISSKLEAGRRSPVTGRRIDSFRRRGISG